MITDWNGMNIPTSISVNSRCAPRNGVLDSTNPLSAPIRQEMITAGTVICSEFHRLPDRFSQATANPDRSIDAGGARNESAACGRALERGRDDHVERDEEPQQQGDAGQQPPATGPCSPWLPCALLAAA